MAQWFDTSVMCWRADDKGVLRKVTDKFLVDATSFAEAEAVTFEKRRPFITGEYKISACRRTSISEITGDMEAERFWLAKIAMVAYDEQTSAEKKKILQVLVGAEDFEKACECIDEFMKGTVSDWELTGMTETKILEVYGHDSANS